MRRLSLILAGLILLSGCIQPVDPNKPADPVQPGQQTKLEQLAFESFQQRDIVRAQKLRSLRGIRYDKKRQAAIEQAGADASRETWAPVSMELSKRLDSIPQTDTAAFDAVLEELARAAERAGK